MEEEVLALPVATLGSIPSTTYIPLNSARSNSECNARGQLEHRQCSPQKHPLIILSHLFLGPVPTSSGGAQVRQSL